MNNESSIFKDIRKHAINIGWSLEMLGINSCAGNGTNLFMQYKRNISKKLG
jgi:hypothetical protein